MSDWGHESEDLFRSARRGLSPSAGDRERVRARIRAKVAAAAVGAAVTGAAAKAAGATSTAAGAGAAGASSAGAGAAGAGVAAKGITLALIAKIAVPVVIAGAGVAAAPHVLSSRASAPPVAPVATVTQVAARPAVAAAPAAVPAPAPAPALAPESVAVEALPAVALPPPPVAPRAIAAAPRATSPVVAAPVAAAPPPSEPAPSTVSAGEEAALVGAIDAALRSGDAAGALRLAADHQQRFPRGALTEEREGARVVARCMSARGPAASDAARSFLAVHPRSPMRARIAAACGTSDPK